MAVSVVNLRSSSGPDLASGTDERLVTAASGVAETTLTCYNPSSAPGQVRVQDAQIPTTYRNLRFYTPPVLENYTLSSHNFDLTLGARLTTGSCAVYFRAGTVDSNGNHSLRWDTGTGATLNTTWQNVSVPTLTANGSVTKGGRFYFDIVAKYDMSASETMEISLDAAHSGLSISQIALNALMVFGEVEENSQIRFNTLGRIVRDTGISFTTLGPIYLDSSLLHNVYASVSVDTDILFNILDAISLDTDILYNVLSTLTPVSVDADVLFNTIAAIYKDTSITYSILAGLLQSYVEIELRLRKNTVNDFVVKKNSLLELGVRT